MQKTVPIVFILFVCALAHGVSEVSDKIDIVVAGYIGHGPIQPFIRIIKDVVPKYGDEVNVTWIDLATEEGQKYFQEHKLTAHLNVMINGKYQYNIDGKNVSFQMGCPMRGGSQWTKADLDAVISELLGAESNIIPVEQVPVAQAKGKQGSSTLVVTFVVLILLAATGAGAWLIMGRQKPQ